MAYLPEFHATLAILDDTDGIDHIVDCESFPLDGEVLNHTIYITTLVDYVQDWWTVVGLRVGFHCRCSS